MADIFLSYAREDAKRAEAIARALEIRGWSVFWDRRIPHGSNFRAHLQKQLESARCILVLWSTAAIASQFVLDEAAEGLEDGRLVPALIEAVKPPLGFRGLQAADLTERQELESESHELQALLVSIGGIVSPVLGNTGGTTPTAPDKWWNSLFRPSLGSLAVVVALFAIIATLMWWTVSGTRTTSSDGPAMMSLPPAQAASRDAATPSVDRFTVDVRVWSDLARNRLKQDVVRRSNEYVAVVLYGSESFDVRDVNINSVYLSDGTGSAVPAAMYHLQEGYDENHDGKDDLKLDYRVADLKSSGNQLYTSSTFQISGRLKDDKGARAFQGTHAVAVID
jgi:hypothetical protein